MGHFNEFEYAKSYQSRLVRVDTQGLTLRGEQDKTIDFAKFLRVQRGHRPPDGLPHSISKAIEEQVMGSKLQGQPQYNLRRNLKERARKKFIEAWHKENRGSEKPPEPSANLPDSVELLGELSDSRVQSQIKQRFSPAYMLIADACRQKNYRLQDNAPLIEYLSELPDRNQPFYYPDEMPIRTPSGEGTVFWCPVCKSDITKYVIPHFRNSIADKVIASRHELVTFTTAYAKGCGRIITLTTSPHIASGATFGSHISTTTRNIVADISMKLICSAACSTSKKLFLSQVDVLFVWRTRAFLGIYECKNSIKQQSSARTWNGISLHLARPYRARTLDVPKLAFSHPGILKITCKTFTPSSIPRWIREAGTKKAANALHVESTHLPAT